MIARKVKIRVGAEDRILSLRRDVRRSRERIGGVIPPLSGGQELTPGGRICVTPLKNMEGQSVFLSLC